jgi:hypothetical protein
MERLAAWLVTGPLGHLVAGVADWVTMLVRWRVQVARRRRAQRERSSRVEPSR